MRVRRRRLHNSGMQGGASHVWASECIAAFLTTGLTAFGDGDEGCIAMGWMPLRKAWFSGCGCRRGATCALQACVSSPHPSLGVRASRQDFPPLVMEGRSRPFVFLIDELPSGAVRQCLGVLVADDDIVEHHPVEFLPNVRGKVAPKYLSKSDEPRTPGGVSSKVSLGQFGNSGACNWGEAGGQRYFEKAVLKCEAGKESSLDITRKSGAGIWGLELRRGKITQSHTEPQKDQRSGQKSPNRSQLLF